jgi:hypothetical protein
MMIVSGNDKKNRLAKQGIFALLLFVVALIFYLVTLQPSLAWGDGIRLQREAITAESFILAEIVDVDFAPDPFPFAKIGVAAWDHPLYVILGHSLVRLLPDVHALWLVNVISAIFGAGTIALFYLLCFRHTKTHTASLLAAAALTLSHTFWWHAVTPEVYTLFTFLLLLALILFDIFEQNGRFRYLLASAFVMGLGIANHLLAVLAVPALLLYLLLAHKSPRAYLSNFRQLFWLAAAFLAGLLPYLVQFARLLRTFSLAEVMGTAVGTTFLQGSLTFEPAALLQSAAAYLVLLIYQFLLLGLFLGVIGWWNGRHSYPALWNKALALYLVYLIFGLVYRVSDQFAFLMAAHIFWAVAIAMGIAKLESITWPDRRRALTAVLTIAMLMTPLLYDIAPDLLRTVGVSEEDFGVPQIGTGVRDGLAYYANPNKNGDITAYEFGRETLVNLPREAVVIAQFYVDTDEYFVLRYFAAVEGLRTDVSVAGWPTVDPFNFDPGLVHELIRTELLEKPVYLASLSAEYYDSPTLLAEYCIVVENNLYRVYEKTAGGGKPCLPPNSTEASVSRNFGLDGG